MLKKSIDEYIEKNMYEFLYSISHKYDVDICKFENIFLSNYLTYDDFKKIHWQEIYKDSYFNILVNSSIVNSGLLSKE